MTILVKNCKVLKSIHEVTTNMVITMLDEMVDKESSEAFLMIGGKEGLIELFYRDEWANMTLTEKSEFEEWLFYNHE